MESFDVVDSRAGVPGLALLADWLAGDDELRLWAAVEESLWTVERERRQQLYGAVCRPEAREPSWHRDFPDWLISVAEAVAAATGLDRFPDHCTVEDHPPGSGVLAHRDHPAFGPVVSLLSLGGDTVLELKRPSTSSEQWVYLPARSLCVLAGPARTEWLHGIAARRSDEVGGVEVPRRRRISLTFRSARKPVARPVTSIWETDLSVAASSSSD